MLKEFALLSVLFATGISKPVWAGELDGTQWKMKPKSVLSVLAFWKKADLLKFEKDQFTSAECIPYGFQPGSYNSTKEGDKIAWSAVQTNSQGEKMEWQGSRAGDKMTGTFTWTQPNGKIKVVRWKAKTTTHEHPQGMEHPK